MQPIFTPEAIQELLEAQAWYEERSPGLGFEFARSVDTSLTQALRMPEAYPHIGEHFRYIITRKFPYSIIYSHTVAELVVVAVFHQSRRSSVWQRRVKPHAD